MPTSDADDDTIVGKECHIVAQRDHPSVSRSVSSLSSHERREFAELIEHRHSFKNLTLMCGVHSDVIDDPGQRFTVRQVVEIKRQHEAAMDLFRRSAIGGPPRTATDPNEAPRAPTLLISDAPAWARSATAALARKDSNALAWLHAQIGDPVNPALVTGLITRWPAELDAEPKELVDAVIRHAEAAGLWRSAATAWERLSQRFERAQRADTLARAAVDAGVAGDDDTRERLLPEAEKLHPDGPLDFPRSDGQGWAFGGS